MIIRFADKTFRHRALPFLFIPVSLFSGSQAWAQCNSGVTVSGPLTVTSNCSGNGSKPLTLDTGASVTINSGVTVFNDAGSGRNGDPVSVLASSTGGTLVNHGTLSTSQQWGVTINGTLTSLINTGTISSGARRAVVVNTGGALGTLTNTGTISGPFSDVTNSGTIQTLNNLQGAVANTSDALTYAGALPTTYNIIINSPSIYGQLLNNGATGSMSFGVYGSSVVAAGTYASVLNGFTAANLTGALTGSYSGYNWLLALASGSTTLWNLIFTSAPPNMNAGTTYFLGDVGTTVAPAFDGGTLALLAGDQSAQAFTLNSGGGTLTSSTGGSAKLSGVFSGPGALTVGGTGTLALSGANSYAGGTALTSGTLDISGASPLGTGAVFVASGSTLRGTGNINGAVTVAGTLKPGHSPGFLSVGATVTMVSGSTYQQDIAGATQASAASPAGASGFYSFLRITGGQFVIQPNATLAPRLSGLFTPGEPGFGSATYIPVLGDRYRIVTADGGITGQFATLVQPAELAAGTRLLQLYNIGGSNSLDLAVIPTSYATPGLRDGNANARSAGAALDRMVLASESGAATATQNRLLLSASLQTGASLPAFTRGLAGEVYGATLATVPQTSLRMQQSVLKPHERGAWGEVAYQHARRSSDGNASSFTSNLSQLVAGVDAYDKDGIRAGGGVSFSSTDVRAEQGSGQVRQGALFVYANVPQGDWTLDTLASAGVHGTDHSRSDVTGTTGKLGARAHGNDLLLSAGISRAMSVEGTRISPYARLTWQQVRQSAASEGGSPAALTVDRYKGEGVRAVVGMSAGSLNADPLKDRQTWQLDLGVGADSSKLVSPMLNASLAGVSTLIRTPGAGTGFMQAGLSGTYRFGTRAFAYAGVAAEMRRGAVQGSVNTGVRLQF